MGYQTSVTQYINILTKLKPYAQRKGDKLGKTVNFLLKGFTGIKRDAPKHLFDDMEQFAKTVLPAKLAPLFEQDQVIKSVVALKKLTKIVEEKTVNGDETGEWALYISALFLCLLFYVFRMLHVVAKISEGITPPERGKVYPLPNNGFPIVAHHTIWTNMAFIQDFYDIIKLVTKDFDKLESTRAILYSDEKQYLDTALYRFSQEMWSKDLDRKFWNIAKGE